MIQRVAIGAVILVVAFLAGFVPQYAKARRLDGELRQVRMQNEAGQLRDLAGLAYVQSNQKNYGLAAETCARFFNKAREVADQSQDPSRRKTLEDVIAMRDQVTAALAKGDPAVLNDLQQIYLNTREATRPTE